MRKLYPYLGALAAVIAIVAVTAAGPSSDAQKVEAASPPPAEAVTTTTDPGPTQAEIDRLHTAMWVNTVNTNRWVSETNYRTWMAAAVEHEAEQARIAQERAEAARRNAADAAAERRAVPPDTPAAESTGSSGRCGGDLPPCWVMMRESGGNIRARNPSSSASGKWQFIRSTWANFGGYAEAYLAPESVQDAKARILWAGGAGCGHWSAC